jgi:dCTP deaminase
MILTGQEILRRWQKGDDIKIDPFDPKKINPNSYNLTLFPELKIYTNQIINPKYIKTKTIEIPKNGLLLHPDILYLGSTNEHTETYNLVPKIDGRSSIGRLGISVHITAGFGDIGFKGKWTLEISVVQPVIIYPNMEICQISYYIPYGDITEYNGRYQNQKTIQESKYFEK